jgi:hypothetical protein
MQRLTTQSGLVQARQAGIQAVRHGPVSWKKVEPVQTDPPTYQWGSMKGLEQDLVSAVGAGIQVMLLVQFTPDWAQAIPGHSCGPIQPEHLDDFAQFLQALVERYSIAPYHVKYWELFNEPDVDPSLVGPDSVFGCWGDEADDFYGGQTYAEMLKHAYPAIKQADPEATVILGGLLLDAPDSTPGQYLAGVLEAGGGDYFDVLGFHAYAYYRPDVYNWDSVPGTKWASWGGFVVGKTAFLRQIMSEYGYDKPLMLNETGLAWWPTEEPTEEYQQAKADYLVKTYTRGLALGLANVTWFGWQQPSWLQMAILDRDLSPAPAYQALGFLIQELEHAEFVGPVKHAGIEGYAFRQDRLLIQVLWSADGQEHPVQAPMNSFLRTFELDGQPAAYEESQGEITFIVRQPVYIEFRLSP